MIARLARWCFRNRWLTLVVWLVVLFGGTAVAQGVIGGDRFETRFSIPDTESLRALELLEEAFPNDDSITDAQLVVEAPRSIDDPEVKSSLASLFVAVTDGVPGLRVTTPYDAPSAGDPVGGARLVSADRTIAYAELGLPTVDSQQEQNALGDRIIEVARTGISILMVEQNARQALEIADKGYVLVQGANRFTGTGAELLANPDVRRSFLGG